MSLQQKKVLLSIILLFSIIPLTSAFNFESGFVFNSNNYTINQNISYYNITGGSYNATYQLYAYNQTKPAMDYADTVAGGNLSWNQSLANTLYADIKWGYNMTSASSGTYNVTYATWSFNQSLPFFNWVAGFLYNYNQSTPFYDWVGTFLYNHNQTTPAISYANANFYNKSADINTTGYNIYAGNITAYEYIMGQPLLGMMGSGLIESKEGATYSSGINVTCTGLTCSYNAFEVRLADTTSSGFAKYCKIPAGSKIITDNTYNTMYIDSNCAIQLTTYDTWMTTMLGKTQAWDFAHVLVHAGTSEIIDTISLEQKRLAKVRLVNYYTNQAKVISGLNIQLNGWNSFNITSGKIIFGMDVVDIGKKNISATGNEIELVGHATSTTWQYIDQRGLNITACDNGTTVIPCTGTSYRRHFIFSIGFDDGDKNEAEIHQLFPLESLTYSSVANCLDTTLNPLVYTMPPEYTGATTMLYAYCAKRTDTTWKTGQMIDMRTVKSGTASSGSDTSGLVPYTGATANVNLASWNITSAYFIGDGRYLTNIPKFNSTYDATTNQWNGNYTEFSKFWYNMTTTSMFNITYDTTTQEWNGNKSLLVPYINAINNLNLGNYNLTASFLTGNQMLINNPSGAGLSFANQNAQINSNGGNLILTATNNIYFRPASGYKTYFDGDGDDVYIGGNLDVIGALTATNICYTNGTGCPASSSYNATYQLYSYNHTSAVNDIWGKWFYNQTQPFTDWLSTFAYNHNQTTPANTYTDAQVATNNRHTHSISNLTAGTMTTNMAMGTENITWTSANMIYDNVTCAIIKGSTSTLSIC